MPMHLPVLKVRAWESSMKMEDIHKIENFDSLNKTVISPVYCIEMYKKQMDLSFYRNHFCLLTILHTHLKNTYVHQLLVHNTFWMIILKDVQKNNHLWFGQNKDHLRFQENYRNLDVLIRDYADF